MAKRFLTHLDLNGNQILNSSFEKLASAPGSGNFEGRMYYDETLNVVRVYDGSAWLDSGLPVVSADPATGNYEGRIVYNITDNAIKYYDGAAWNSVGAGSITSVSGTANEVEVSTVGGSVTVGLPNAVEINTLTIADHVVNEVNITGDLGTAAFVGVSTPVTGFADSWAQLISDPVLHTLLAMSAPNGGTSRIEMSHNDVLGAEIVYDAALNQTMVSSFGASNTASLLLSTANGSIKVRGDGDVEISSLDTAGIVTTTAAGLLSSTSSVPVANGGTGLTATPTNGQLLIGNGTGFTLSTLTDGTGISITEGAGSITIANTDLGSSQNIFKNVAVSGQNTIVADSNNDTLTFAGGTGITLTTSDSTDTLTITNSGVTSITGTANQISASASTGSVTLSLPQNIHTGASPTFAGATLDAIQIGITGTNEIDTTAGNLTIDSAGGTVTIDDNLVISGDLTVSGTTTTVNTETINLADNIITLNSNEAGTPTQNAGIEVERGTSPNVTLRWNETSDTWELTRDGTNYEEITTVGSVTSGDISDFAEAAQDAVGGILVDGTTVDFTYADGTPSITAEVKLATTSYLSTTGGLGVDKSGLETALVTDGFTKKYSANIGNGVLTSISVTHNLGTRDVQVQVYDNATYDTVETDVVRTDTNTVTVSFTQAPASNAYRVVVIG